MPDITTVRNVARRWSNKPTGTSMDKSVFDKNYPYGYFTQEIQDRMLSECKAGNVLSHQFVSERCATASEKYRCGDILGCVSVLSDLIRQMDYSMMRWEEDNVGARK